MKRYGNDQTNLVLTGLAKKVYAQTDPLRIDEIETEDGNYRYSISGCIESSGLTADEVVKALEDWYYEIASMNEVD